MELLSVFKKLELVLGHANQYSIKIDNKIYFISYQTLIAYYDKNSCKLFLNGNWWDFSNTTRKHFKAWLNGLYVYNIKYIDKKSFIKEVQENDAICYMED